MPENTQVHETFAGNRLDPQKWELMQAPIGPGNTHIVQDQVPKLTFLRGRLR